MLNNDDHLFILVQSTHTHTQKIDQLMILIVFNLNQMKRRLNISVLDLVTTNQSVQFSR